MANREITFYYNSLTYMLANLKSKQRAFTTEGVDSNNETVWGAAKGTKGWLAWKDVDGDLQVAAIQKYYDVSEAEWVRRGNVFADIEVDQIYSDTGLKDQYLAADLPISETGQTALAGGFTATSLVGALNELKSGITAADTYWAAESGTATTPKAPYTWIYAIDGFQDQYCAGIPLAESGDGSLDGGFTATSLVGAINELYGGVSTVWSRDGGNGYIYPRTLADYVGIGTDVPDTFLHIYTASAGTIDSHANAVVTIESDDHAVLQFLTPNDKQCGIYLGDEDNNDESYIIYDHATSELDIGIFGTNILNLSSTGLELAYSIDAAFVANVDNQNAGTGAYSAVVLEALGTNSMFRCYGSGHASRAYETWFGPTAGHADADIVFCHSGAELVRIGTDNNIGINGVPSLWAATYNVIQGGAASLMFNATATVGGLVAVNSNMRYNGSWYNIIDDESSQMQQDNGKFRWYSQAAQAPGVLTRSIKMTLLANGYLGIGVTAPVSQLEVWSVTEHPIISITAEHATAYDPMIQFRSDVSDTVKFSIGVDSGDSNKFKIYPGDGVGDTTSFQMSATGTIGVAVASATDTQLKVQTTDAQATIVTGISGATLSDAAVNIGVAGHATGGGAADGANYAIYANAANADNNYAIWAEAGDVYIKAGELSVVKDQASDTSVLIKNHNAAGIAQLELDVLNDASNTFLKVDDVLDTTELAFSFDEFRIRSRGFNPYVKITPSGADYKIHNDGTGAGNLILGGDGNDVVTITDDDIYTDAWVDWSASASEDGFSGTPDVSVHYKKIGRLVFVIFGLEGTSDASNLQFELPYAAATSTQFCCRGEDNGADLAGGACGHVYFNAVSRVEFQPNQNQTVDVVDWTTSGNKGVRGQFFYEATF